MLGAAGEEAEGADLTGLLEFCESLGLPQVTAMGLIQAPAPASLGGLRQQLALLDAAIERLAAGFGKGS